jgi:hypothetical protein
MRYTSVGGSRWKTFLPRSTAYLGAEQHGMVQHITRYNPHKVKVGGAWHASDVYNTTRSCCNACSTTAAAHSMHYKNERS